MDELNYSYFSKEFLSVSLTKLKSMFSFSEILKVKIVSIDHCDGDVKSIKLVLNMDKSNLSQYNVFLSNYISFDDIGISLFELDCTEDLMSLLSKCDQLTHISIFKKNTPVLSVLKCAMSNKMGKKIYKNITENMYILNENVMMFGNLLITNYIENEYCYRSFSTIRQSLTYIICDASDIIIHDEYNSILESYYNGKDDRGDYQLSYNCILNIKNLYIKYNDKKEHYNSITGLLKYAVLYDSIDKSLTVGN